MADNKLELVVTVEVDKANQSIKTVNSSLSSMEASASKSAKGAAQGIDGMTAAMVKGATAGSLFADAIKSALAWGREFTVGSVMMAAENAKAEASLKVLATAHGAGAAAASKQVAAIEEIGFEFTEAAHAVQCLLVADMDLAKAGGLAKLAKAAAAVQNVSAGEAMEAIVLAIESGASRGLRTLGLFADFQKETQIAELQLGRTLTETEEKQIRYNAVMRGGAKIQGAHAAASQTVEGQLGALRRAGGQDHGAGEVHRGAEARRFEPVRAARHGGCGGGCHRLQQLEGHPGTTPGPLRRDAAEGSPRTTPQRQDERRGAAEAGDDGRPDPGTRHREAVATGRAAVRFRRSEADDQDRQRTGP